MGEIRLTTNSAITVHIGKDFEDVAHQLGDFLREKMNNIKEATIAFPGGSAVEILKKAILSKSISTQNWKIFFSDERFVPLDNPDSNHYLNTKSFDGVIAAKNFIPINPNLILKECCEDYFNQMKNAFQIIDPTNPYDFVFDLIVLGLGPDGHTASLFPEQKDLNKWGNNLIPIENSPKPPPERISFGLPLIRRAKNIVVIACGSSKACAFKEIATNTDCELPGALVCKNSRSSVHWFVDKECARYCDFCL